MTQVYHSRKLKIVVDTLPLSTLIKVCFRKWEMVAISDNEEELQIDIQDALSMIPSKCGRRWFKQAIENQKPYQFQYDILQSNTTRKSDN